MPETAFTSTVERFGACEISFLFACFFSIKHQPLLYHGKCLIRGYTCCSDAKLVIQRPVRMSRETLHEYIVYPQGLLFLKFWPNFHCLEIKTHAVSSQLWPFKLLRVNLRLKAWRVGKYYILWKKQPMRTEGDHGYGNVSLTQCFNARNGINKDSIFVHFKNWKRVLRFWMAALQASCSWVFFFARLVFVGEMVSPGRCTQTVHSGSQCGCIWSQGPFRQRLPDLGRKSDFCLLCPVKGPTASWVVVAPLGPSISSWNNGELAQCLRWAQGFASWVHPTLMSTPEKCTIYPTVLLGETNYSPGGWQRWECNPGPSHSRAHGRLHTIVIGGLSSMEFRRSFNATIC